MGQTHTKGPWIMSGTTLLHVTGTPANIQVAMVTECRPSDARLIAAAPELLVALESAVKTIHSLGAPKQITEYSRNVIAKARGQA